MQMKLQTQHFLLSYFKTLNDGPAGGKLTLRCMACSAEDCKQQDLRQFREVLPSIISPFGNTDTIIQLELSS